MAAGVLFGSLNRPEQAYALGWVAVAGRPVEGGLFITLTADSPLHRLLVAKEAVEDEADAASFERDGARVRGPLAGEAARFLGAPLDEVDRLGFPSLEPALLGAFCRGLFDAAGSISQPKRGRLAVRLARPGERLLENFLDFVGAPPRHLGARTIRWEGPAALDLLGRLYDGFAPPDDAEEMLLRPKHLQRYRAFCARVGHFRADRLGLSAISVQRVRPDARLPSKERVSDSGYDLTLLYEKKRFGATVLYGTGLVVEPPEGWYFDVVARSSIIKLGYMVANSVGVIDRAYRGEILVPLVKIDPDAPDLELPARVAQLIPRPIVHFPVVELAELGKTQRGAGGFGSTG